MDLSFQEKSSWGTLTITDFEGGYYCRRLFDVVAGEVVKYNLPPIPYRRVL